MQIKDFLPKDTIDTIQKMGAPSFEEFKRNRDKYMGRPDDVLSSVDQGGTMLKGYMKKVRYELEGYRCATLEEVERVASSQGIELSDLDYRAVCVPQSGYTCDILVKFMTKAEYERRRAIEKQAIRQRQTKAG